jgi:DNA-binding GntR family transcriptional regulator
MRMHRRHAGAVESDGPAPPRYRKLADRLIDEIRSGQRPIGSTLPGELELTAELGVSRHTVREALRRLDDLGLIERRRRAGTVVAAREPVMAYSHAVRSLGDLLQYPSRSRLEILESRALTLNARMAREFGGRPGSRWFSMRAIRRMPAGRAPLCTVDILVRPKFAAILAEVGRNRMRVFELIEQRFALRVANVRVDISAGSAAADVASTLGIAAGAPVLRVLRSYFDDQGQLFEIARSQHSADRFAYTLTVQREWLAAAVSPESSPA